MQKPDSKQLSPLPEPRNVRIAYLHAPTSVPGLFNGQTTLDIGGVCKGCEMTLGNHGLLLLKGDIGALIPYSNIKSATFA